VWTTSQSIRCRPSELLGIADPFVAFSVDRAISTFAADIDHDQEVATGRLPKNAKESTHQHTRQRVLDTYLGIEAATQPGRFKSPGITK
jgi:hypothetical protein